MSAYMSELAQKACLRGVLNNLTIILSQSKAELQNVDALQTHLAQSTGYDFIKKKKRFGIDNI